MALVGRTTTEVPIPHEPGEHLVLRELSGNELDEARRTAVRSAMESVAGLDPSMFEKLRREEVTAAEEREASLDDWTLIRYGVVGWSYPDQCDDESKRELDARTWRFAADTIREMNTRTDAEKKGYAQTSGADSSPPDSDISTS